LVRRDARGDAGVAREIGEGAAGESIGAVTKDAKRLFVAGLTGSIGMGKTETARMFAKLGMPVYDADSAVHALYAEGGAAVAPIAAAFPGAVVEGRVDRARLMERLKADETGFERLERIVHPLVLETRRKFLEDAHARGEDVVLLDIPLLFETASHKDVDAIVVVSAPSHIQRGRVLERPGMSPEKLAAIEARQTPDAEKRAKADFVIETGYGLEQAFEEVKKVIAELRRRAKDASKHRHA
jgi:dephospho-CoA kinase